MGSFLIKVNSIEWIQLSADIKFLKELNEILKKYEGKRSVEILIVDEKKRISLVNKVTITNDLKESVKTLIDKYLNLLASIENEKNSKLENKDYEILNIDGLEAQIIKVDADALDKKNKERNNLSYKNISKNKNVRPRITKEDIMNIDQQRVQKNTEKELQARKKIEKDKSESIKLQAIQNKKNIKFWEENYRGIADSCGEKCGQTFRDGKYINKKIFQTEEIAKEYLRFNQELYECEFNMGWHIKTKFYIFE